MDSKSSVKACCRLALDSVKFSIAYQTAIFLFQPGMKDLDDNFSPKTTNIVFSMSLLAFRFRQDSNMTSLSENNKSTISLTFTAQTLTQFRYAMVLIISTIYSIQQMDL